MPAVLRPRRPEDFELLHEGTPPWETGRTQPALPALAEAGAIRGGILDLADLGEQFDTSMEPVMMDSAVQRGAVHAWLAAITRT